jgi:hypothetical protein
MRTSEPSTSAASRSGFPGRCLGRSAATRDLLSRSFERKADFISWVQGFNAQDAERHSLLTPRCQQGFPMLLS